MLSVLFGEVLDGVQRALGRAPGDFSDYARDVAVGGSDEDPIWLKS
jgi:hypothetical protein